MSEVPAPPTAGRPRVAFADRLDALVRERRSTVVLGLDPDPGLLWPEAVEAVRASDRGPREGTRRPAASAAARAVAAHCRALIAAAGPACVAVKPQLACFERLGGPGWEALRATCEAAREAGLLVVADGKRGDVPVTAAAYAQALVGSTPTPFGPVDGLGADAFTANPLLGPDALEPLIASAIDHDAGVFVLVRTSNPGATHLQDRPLADGPTVSERLADLVDALGRAAGPAPVSGLAPVGAVVGATVPEQLRALRARMPRAILLLPGIGAQGGRVEDLAPAWAPGPAGALISASRSLAAPPSATGASRADASRAAAEELRQRAWILVAGGGERGTIARL